MNNDIKILLKLLTSYMYVGTLNISIYGNKWYDLVSVYSSYGGNFYLVILLLFYLETKLILCSYLCTTARVKILGYLLS